MFDRRHFLGTATMGVMAARFGALGKLMARTALQLSLEGEMPSFNGANGWLNSPPLTPAGLRGKVVLVDFWTYTCVNWLRTLPYARAWAEKYQNQGLVVIGVHTPEFAFERNIDNVRRAAKDMRVDYPIAIDNDYAIWRAFNNQYWPALYFIDAQGRIRHHKFGEGEYEQSEIVIKQLLTEAGIRGLGHELAGAIKLGSGAFDGQYSYNSRFAEGVGTNPEELMGAAHAGCFSMALAERGHAPTNIHTSAKVQFGPAPGGFAITRIDLVTNASVPGIDAAGFQKV